MSVSLVGAEVLIKTLRKAKEAANKAAERQVEKARLAVETTAKKLIATGPKSGEIYTRGEISHRASAPGEAPATEPAAWDGGQLISSIESKSEVVRPGVASAVVWTEKKYGRWLEFGTEYIEPRPWLTPAVEQNRARFPKALGEAVVKACEDAAK